MKFLPALPLLGKELLEIAARRRTYITRVVYALLLGLFFILWNLSLFRRMGGNALAMLGTGRQMFLSLLVLQLGGIYLFLPAMAAGQITQEKERDSLVLLLLTDLGPWQILLQKYLSSLLAIFSFLLIGLPLAALSYAYGGISSIMLLQGVWILFLTSLQVAAFALLCSARSRTTVAAFISTYLGGVCLFIGLGLTGEFLGRAFSTPGNYVRYGEDFVRIFPPTLLDAQPSSIAEVLKAGLPSLGFTLLCLLLARFFLIRRAFAPATNPLLQLFKALDRFMHRGNRLLGSISFGRTGRTLPGDDPIAWRELTQRSLGRPEYCLRVLIVLEIVTVFLCLFATQGNLSGQQYGFSIMAALFGALGVLTLSALAANAFVSERVNQTLEVLLTTPLRSAHLVQQKARTLRRMACIVAVPLATIFLVEAWAENQAGYHGSDALLYLTCSALTLAIYLPLVLWLSLWLGMKLRTRFRAILTALAVLVTWCAVPLLFVAFGEISERHPGAIIAYLSPLTVPAFNEVGDLDNLWPEFEPLAVALNFFFYGTLLFFLRRHCLRHADRYLRG